jgi:pyruvate dehydrogenase E2 component (dihydrolipoyllysine-residue acetyltransferase)
MPSLGADMEAGTLVQWRVAPGSHIRRGDVVALVETEKGIIDVESFEDGVVEKLIVETGVRVPVGTPLALLEGEAAISAIETPAAPAPPTTSSLHAPPPAPRAAASGIAPVIDQGMAPVAAPVSAHPRRVSPAARARAAALSIDLASIKGTGPSGVVTLQDVEHAAREAERPKATPLAPPSIGASSTGAMAASLPAARGGMRSAIAASMSRSKREIPHYYLQLSMDFQRAASWLEAFNQERPVPERVLTAVLLIKAAARAAAEKPGFNGYFRDGGFEPAPSVNMGVAIALRGGGLVAPAIFDADRKPIATIMHELQDLVGRVRAGHMRSSEISSATLTVTSLGDEGVDTLYPIIYPPQVAIVGFGSVIERPWAIDGRVEPRPVLSLTLAADHRVTDGRQGAQFLARIRDWLSRPGDL